MSSKLVRVLLTVTLIGGSLGYLFYTTLSKDTEYYKHVDEVMANPQAWHGKRLQMHGFVTNGSIYSDKATLDYVFTLENKGQVANIAYRGVVPDTFKGGAEVVVSGTFDGKAFHAESMTAKCPSKYDPKVGNPAGAARSATSGGGQ